MRRKPGPKNGSYVKLLASSRSIPKPNKPWRQMSKLERSRLKDVRALWRRTHQARKYKKVAAFILKVREKLGLTPAEFAAKLDVSIISVRRWERGYGYSPRPDIMEQIKQLRRK
jgi:DNA-binding transcriptional regulator YiaG